MATQSQTQSTGGIGFAGLLTILFIALKLTGNITWSWLWVLSPLWISFAFWLAVLLIVLLVVGIGSTVSERRTAKRRRARRGW